MDGKDKKEILDYLAKYKLMSLGTYFKLPWAASVYFLFDDKFNFYFVSNPKTQHCVNIEKNPKVSITVANSAQKASDKKIGFQARGSASRVTSVTELKYIIGAWNQRQFDAPTLTYKTLQKVWKSKFYKVKITDIQMFDESKPEDLETRKWKI